MFINKKQMPHAKYGRDLCAGCLRKLGYGGDLLARAFHCDRSTILKIVQERVTIPRYEGFDDARRQHRSVNRKEVTENKTIADVTNFQYEAFVIAEIQSMVTLERAYNAMYSRKFRHFERNTILRKKRDKSKPHYIELQRRGNHRRKGVPEDQIPEKGAYLEKLLANLSPEERRDIRRIRRKRDALRRSVVEVWKGRVGDAAAIYRVGCSVAEFQQWVWLRMKPEWNELNYGTVWNFDHVLPCASFDVFDRTSVKKLNHYTNIRPLCVRENSLKGSHVLDVG